jgi:sRNA-binding carbon storage regulator CsrA
MLVLTRMKDEAVLIGLDVVVTVREFGDDNVRLEIQFPAGMALTGPQGPGAIEQVDSETTPAGSSIARWAVRVKERDLLRIGEAISVLVVSLPRGKDGIPSKVRLGFDSPPDLRIDRQEIRAIRTAKGQLSATNEVQ